MWCGKPNGLPPSQFLLHEVKHLVNEFTEFFVDLNWF